MSLGLFLLTILAVTVLAPGVVIIATPARAARAATGWTIFAIGLFVLDCWTASAEPYDDDGLGLALSIPLLFASGVVLTIAIGVRHRALFPRAPTENEPPRHAAFGWSIPFGALAGVVFVHWLRNMLAGAEPAARVHGAVLIAFALAGLLAGRGLARHAGRIAGWLRGALVFAVMGVILVSANIAMGFWIWQKARDFAAGSPHCVMTYDDFRIQRAAQSGWELSPLVNRRYGVWAIRKAPFLTVQEGTATKSYRYFHGQWRDVTNWEDGAHISPHCQPVMVP